MIWYVLGSAFVIMLASLTGAVFTWKALGSWMAPRLRYLVALAAGVFVVIVYGLAEEVLHEGVSTQAIGAFFFGAVLLEVVTQLLPRNTHHHHGPHPEHAHGKIDARRMLLGDAVHNIHDGLTLVPAFIASPVVGFGTAGAILLHELVQEVSEFFVLKEAGYTTKKALLWNFTVSATILAGVGLSLTLASVHELAVPLIAFSAGGFSYILLRDLLPSIVSHARAENRMLYYLAAFFAGIAVMTAVSMFTPHTHEHDEEFFLPEGFGLASIDYAAVL